MLQGVWNINFFCQSLKITSDILRYIRYSALKCHLAAAFCFIINVAWFIFSDLSSDAWAFSCVYTKRYIIYGQNSQSEEFQQSNLLKSCIGSLVKSENLHRTASPLDLAHCEGRASAARVSFDLQKRWILRFTAVFQDCLEGGDWRIKRGSGNPYWQHNDLTWRNQILAAVRTWGGGWLRMCIAYLKRGQLGPSLATIPSKESWREWSRARAGRLPAKK